MSALALDCIWIDVCSVDDIPMLGARRISGTKAPIAIFRAGDGQVYALEDRCPHKQGPLSMGIVHDASVTCPLHAMRISLVTGELMGADAGKGCATVVKARVVSGWVQISGEALL
jgi:nitrite reductase [NAD(P)H] small subunit